MVHPEITNRVKAIVIVAAVIIILIVVFVDWNTIL